MAKCISKLHYVLKRRKFRPKMRQNVFGGRAPPGPAGGVSALPQTPNRNWGCLLLREGGEGSEKGKEGDGKREGRREEE